MDLEWICVGKSITSNISRLDSMLCIGHSGFSKYFKFRGNSEKTVTSIFQSDTAASIDEFTWISSGYVSGSPLLPIFLDWTRCYASDTLVSQNISNFAEIQKKPSLRYFRATQGLQSMNSHGSRVDMCREVHYFQYFSIGLDVMHRTLWFLKIFHISRKFRKNRHFDISERHSGFNR